MRGWVARMAERRRAQHNFSVVMGLLIEYYENGGTTEDLMMPVIEQDVEWDTVLGCWFIRECHPVGQKILFDETGRGGLTEVAWVTRKISESVCSVSFEEPK